MKIIVLHENGNHETLTLVPPVVVVLGDSLNRLKDSSGMEHWFTLDGH